jgi:hypothetical protein
MISLTLDEVDAKDVRDERDRQPAGKSQPANTNAPSPKASPTLWVRAC